MRIKTIDAHVAGSATRIITDGLGEIVGKTMTEKMQYFSNHYNDVGNLIILEPRGHKHMWGAVITEPCDPSAQIGAFFINSQGTFPLSVHSTISLVKVGIEYNLFEAPAVGEAIKIDMPVGVISAYPTIVDGKVQSVAVESTEAFVHMPRVKVMLETGNFVNASIVYSGVYFLLVDMNQVGFYDRRTELLSTHSGIEKLTMRAMNILNQINKKYDLEDPRNPGEPAKIEMAMFYDETGPNQANDVVINARGSADRCPCGSAMGAKLALLHSEGRLEADQSYELVSPIQTSLTGEISVIDSQTGKPSIIPKVSGTAYITGEHTFFLDEEDTITAGFVL